MSGYKWLSAASKKGQQGEFLVSAGALPRIKECKSKAANFEIIRK
jgi:hypothetical protein